MLKTCSDQTTKYQSHFKREFSTIGKSFMQLGSAMQQDGNTSKITVRYLRVKCRLNIKVIIRYFLPPLRPVLGNGASVTISYLS